MKVFHFPFNPHGAAVRPLAGQVAAGDVVIVSLDRSVRRLVEQIITTQFALKTDATALLQTLANSFKEAAPFPEYVAYVDKVVARMEVFLYEGMTLQMKGNDFLYYLSALVTELAAKAVDTAVAMNAAGDHGIPVPDYVDENVSTKVVKIIQSYTGIVNKMVWRKI